MNGRVYDYNLGRFLSVDPFIQGVGNSQGINPYSYVLNNPLAFTDPSGYCAAETGTRIKKCVDVEVTNSDTGETSTKSINVMHSKASAHINNHIMSVLGSGAQIDSVSVTNKSGDIVDLNSHNHVNTNSLDLAQQSPQERYTMPESKRAELDARIAALTKEHNLSREFSGENAEEEAAFAWANAMNPISVEYDVELGARIFEDRSKPGTFLIGNTITSYKNFVLKNMNRSRLKTLLGFKYIADIHTHGKGNKDGSSEFFSGGNTTQIRSPYSGDLVRAASVYSNAYLATPDGKLKKFTFANWEYQKGAKASSAVTTIGDIKK